MTRSTYVLASLIVCLAACSAPPCPAGSVSVGDRCIATDSDGGVDDGSVDAASDDSATSEDAALGPDACTQVTYYADLDDDEHGDEEESLMACEMPAGYVISSDDCDDEATTTNPSADEICDGIDNNCDDEADETFGCVRLTNTACTTLCGTTGSGLCSESCELPSAATCLVPTESCNGVDDDCDGVVDDDEQVFVREVVTNIPTSIGGITQVVTAPHDNGFVVIANLDAEFVPTEGWAQRFSNTGAPLGTATQISSTGFSSDFRAFIYEEDLVLVWPRNGYEVWYARMRLSDGVIVTPETRILTNASSSYEWDLFHAVAVGTDIVLLAYESDGDIAYRRVSAIDPTPSTTGMTTLLDRPSSAARSFVAAYSASTNVIVIAYAAIPSDETDLELYVQRIDATTLGPIGTPYRMTYDDVDEELDAIALADRLPYPSSGVDINLVSRRESGVFVSALRIVAGTPPTLADSTSSFDPFYEATSSSCPLCGASTAATRGGRTLVMTLDGTGLDETFAFRTSFNASTTAIISPPRTDIASTVPSCLNATCTPTTEFNTSIHVAFLSDDRAVFTTAGGERPPRVYLWACPE